MPSNDQLAAVGNDPKAIRNIVERNVGIRKSREEAFNAELGGKSDTYSKASNETYQMINSSGNLVDVPRSHSESGFQRDAFSSLKNTALGMKPNIAYEPDQNKRQNRSLSQIDAGAYSDVFFGTSGNPNDKEFVSMYQEQPWYRSGNEQAEKVGEKISAAQDKIVSAASKHGYPIWKDKELMADPEFRKRVLADPKLGPKVRQLEENDKISDESIAALHPETIQ